MGIVTRRAELPSGYHRKEPDMDGKKNAVSFSVNAPYGLNLRDAPGGAIKAVLPHKSKVSVSETKGDWSRVSANRKTGWVKHEYLIEGAV